MLKTTTPPAALTALPTEPSYWVFAYQANGCREPVGVCLPPTEAWRVATEAARSWYRPIKSVRIEEMGRDGRPATTVATLEVL